MKKKKGTNIYEKKVTLGRDDTGKPVRLSVYGRTKSEIEQKIFEARQSWLETAATPNNDIAFITYCRRWLTQEKASRGIRTKEMYQGIIDRYLAKDYPDQFFSEISQTDLQETINKNFTKYETCNKIKLTLRQIYNAAEEEGLISHGKVNVSKLTLPPKVHTEKRALTDAEKEALFAADLTDKQRAFVLTLYFTGMRCEEALALVPEAFNFKTKMVCVSQVVIRDGSSAIVQRTAKNDYSLRDINLPDKYIKAVKPYIDSCKGFLFGMERKDNAPMTHSSFMKFWSGIRKALALIEPSAQTLTPHIFRHNYATMLYYSNITLKKAAKLMGHADTTMIMKVYAHLDDQKENTAEKLNAIF